MTPRDDERLITESKHGSQEAFSQIVGQHQDAVYTICYRMTGNPAEAEDMAQEAFLRLYRSLPRLRRGTRLRAWLHKVAVNVCLDALRKRKDATLPLDELREGHLEPPTPHGETHPEDAYLRGEQQLDVQKALLRLPGEYRAALFLRYYGELSYKEIASTLGVPVSTVETRIFRAKKMLAQIVSPSTEGGEEGV